MGAFGDGVEKARPGADAVVVADVAAGLLGEFEQSGADVGMPVGDVDTFADVAVGVEQQGGIKTHGVAGFCRRERAPASSGRSAGIGVRQGAGPLAINEKIGRFAMIADLMSSLTVEHRSVRWRWGNPMPWVGGLTLALMIVACLVTLPWTIDHYAVNHLDSKLLAPGGAGGWLGTDALGRSMLVRCLLGGSISLGIGMAAATISVFIGTTWGLISGYAGGRVDQVMMRTVDVLYSLPYILLVVLLSVALQPVLERVLNELAANLITLLLAIGSVSWLTLARVVRGQVLSIKAMPFIEAAEAVGTPTRWILLRHILPNLIGPIIVYTTLTVPQAILQESFLSFLGIGVQPPLPSWGNLAAVGLNELNPVESHWWLLTWPCVLLAVTLLSLNFVGEALRDRFDPRSKQNALA